MEWEYHVEAMDFADSETLHKNLNGRGWMRWELIAVIPNPDPDKARPLAIFKRPLKRA